MDQVFGRSVVLWGIQEAEEDEIGWIVAFAFLEQG